jgi:hypothetical protein
MKAPKPVYTPAPDPYAAAGAQTASNKETAIANAGINMVNQYTPEGKLEYSTNGLWGDGTPRYEVRQELSPENAAIRKQELEFDKLSNSIALRQTLTSRWNSTTRLRKPASMNWRARGSIRALLRKTRS